MNAHGGTGLVRVVSMLMAWVLIWGQGCFRSYAVPIAELQKLDGFEASARPSSEEARKLSQHRTALAPFRMLRSADGFSVRFDSSTSLWLEAGASSFGGKFQRIQVTPSLFDGVLLDEAHPLHLELSTVQQARLVAIDAQATNAAVTGAVAVGVGSLLFLLLASSLGGCGIMVCG
ncbi:MAG TPA: hypothetical protein VIG99_01290 [Myxococcaceae bacterium]|jgi:hypothetical protein